MEPQAANSSRRILSIDAFRGLTILVMIFVNDLAGVRNIPAWMKHMSPRIDGMTFVDVVFPAFLFIVGLSIPFALEKRLASGKTEISLWGHILLRFLGLLLIGVFMVNEEYLPREGMAVSPALWSLILYCCVILTWNLYPRKEKNTVPMILKAAGLSGLLLLALLFRAERGTGFGFHWWGILGLIGWAYLPACLIYRFFRRNTAVIVGFIALFTALYIGDRLWTNHFTTVAESWRWGLQIGAHGSITLAGVLAGIIMRNREPSSTPHKKIVALLSLTFFLGLGGFFLRPLFGISKNMATPAWCLYSSAWSCAIFALLYWLIDVRGWSRWTAFLKPAGENPLLAYILPQILAAALALAGITLLQKPFLSTGLIGFCRSLFISLSLVWITGRLGRLGLRLRF